MLLVQGTSGRLRGSARRGMDTGRLMAVVIAVVVRCWGVVVCSRASIWWRKR